MGSQDTNVDSDGVAIGPFNERLKDFNGGTTKFPT